MSFFRIVSLQLLVVLHAVVFLDSFQTWEEPQQFPPHLIPEGAMNPARLIVRKKIVEYHNFFRTKVKPTASNMLLMSWHPEAARLAQLYADECIFLQHNDPLARAVQHLGPCGQNIFVSARRTPWFFAIKRWFTEYKNFTYGYPYPVLMDVGHYTQMVWATSHKVGCGVAKCAGGPWGVFYNYVCHYCPSGNYESLVHYPYKKGKPCADCPNDCVAGSLCKNACMRTNVFSNCDELVSNSRSYCGSLNCNATCECGNSKIYKNYPW